MTKDRPTRRALMASLAGLPLVGAAPSSVDAEGTAPASSASGEEKAPVTPASTLVTYFSRSGNTRVVAGLLQRAFGAESFEIRPAVAYPDEYLATVEQARQERDRGVEPALASTVLGIAGFDTVFLGFPIWGQTAPPIVRSFLSAHDMTGKTLVPFVTHGGYGLGDSQAVVRRHAPKARLRSAFVMEADQERRTMDRVNEWLHTLPRR